MGIHPYGLFGTYESNTPFGKNYEIQHQLDVRQAQLNALSKKTNLSDDDIAKKEQLNKTINMLSNKLGNNASTAATSQSNANENSFTQQTKNARNTSETHSVSLGKNNNVSVSSASSATSTIAGSKAIFPEGSVISKNQNAGIYSPTQVTTQDSSYLKGFFIDLKL